MRKIHKLMIQDVIITHTLLYKSKENCKQLTDEDTEYCNFRKDFTFICEYRGEKREIRVLQIVKLKEILDKSYTYPYYQLGVQLGALTPWYYGELAFHCLERLLQVNDCFYNDVLNETSSN